MSANESVHKSHLQFEAYGGWSDRSAIGILHYGYRLYKNVV